MHLSQVISKQQVSRLGQTFVICFLGSIFIALSQVAIHLPFSVVPISFQTHAVLFLALILGSKRAAFSTFLFLMQGMLGLPVFAFGGSLLSLFGPTGGYLVGYMVAAYVAGYIFEKSQSKSKGIAFIACQVGMGVIYLFGFSWLQTFVGFSKAFTLGVLPFVLIDLLKTVAILPLFYLKLPHKKL